MKIWFIIMPVLMVPVFVEAQSFQIDKPALSIDSLKKALPLLQDSPRVDCLNELTRSYIEAGKSDSAMATARHAYNEASGINYIKGLGDACIQYAMIDTWMSFNHAESEKYYREAIFWYEKIQAENGLGLGYWGLGKILLGSKTDEAGKAFNRSAFHFTKAGNRIMLANLMDNIGQVYGLKGDFEKHFEYVKNGLQEKKRIHDSRGIIWSYYNLAYIYQSVEDYQTALDYFRLSFQQARSQSIRWNISRSMGNIFLYMENYDSSLYYFRKMLEIIPSDAPAMAGLGKLFLLRKEYDKALYYMQNALAGFTKNSNHVKAAWVKMNIGKTYLGMKNYKAALQYAQECLIMAGETNKQMMQNVYEVYWKMYEDLKQKDSAYFYFQKFVTLKDSLDDARFKSQYLQKLALYKVETREEQQQARIDLLNKDNQIKQQELQKVALQKKILIGSLVVLALVSIILFRNIALKRKNEKHQRELAENELQIQKLETQKELAELEMQALRSQMNPHFIFNCLSSINRFILKNESETASDYLTKFSRLIRMVLNNSKNTLIILEDELEMLRLYLDLERLRFKNSFDYSISFRNHFDVSSIFIPPLLLQPFAENAIWHGLMHKEEGQGNLEIAFELENNVLNCYLTDNGVGRKKAASFKSKSAEKQKSMGMQITAGRLALLNRDTEQTTFCFEDLVDPEGKPSGTRVLLKIRYLEAIERTA